MAADDGAVAVEDRADRVDDGEDRDPVVADLPEGGALAGRLALLVVEHLADGRRPSRTP